MRIIDFVCIILSLTLGLTGCALNQGFPKELKGDLKPINSQKVIKDVE